LNLQSVPGFQVLIYISTYYVNMISSAQLHGSLSSGKITSRIDILRNKK